MGHGGRQTRIILGNVEMKLTAHVCIAEAEWHARDGVVLKHQSRQVQVQLSKALLEVCLADTRTGDRHVSDLCLLFESIQTQINGAKCRQGSPLTPH